MPYALFLLVGPDPIEIDRLRDLFAAITVYEADSIGRCDIFIANDGNTALDELSTLLGTFRNTIIFDNPGRGVSPHVWDRHINGTFAGLQHITQTDQYQFVLKLDCDALVIAPFVQRLAQFFADYPRAGAIGTHLHFPCGKSRPGNFTMTQHIQQAMQAIPVPERIATADNAAYEKRVPATQLERQQLIQAARQNGHFGSQHVQGGGYALSATLLSTLHDRRWPTSIDLFNGTGLGEDVATAILVKAAGLELMDCNHPGEVFGVWWQQLGLSLDEIVRRDYAVIHSIKDIGHQREAEIRRYFAARRETYG